MCFQVFQGVKRTNKLLFKTNDIFLMLAFSWCPSQTFLCLGCLSPFCHPSRLPFTFWPAPRLRPIAFAHSTVHACPHLYMPSFPTNRFAPSGGIGVHGSDTPLSTVSSIPVAVTPPEPGTLCIISNSLPCTTMPTPNTFRLPWYPCRHSPLHRPVPSLSRECSNAMSATAGYILVERSRSIRRWFTHKWRSRGIRSVCHHGDVFTSTIHRYPCVSSSLHKTNTTCFNQEFLN
jgi:hypothetical protein